MRVAWIPGSPLRGARNDRGDGLLRCIRSGKTGGHHGAHPATDHGQARRAAYAAVPGAALGAGQHRPLQRHRLGPAALDLHLRPVRDGGPGRHRGRARARQENGRHCAGVRGGGAPARGQGQGGRGRRQHGLGARQLFHGGGLLGRGAMALRPERRAERRLPSEEARELRQVRRPSPTTRSRRRGFRSKTPRCRPGFTCRRTTRAGKSRW